jgi:hypothetical protein
MSRNVSDPVISQVAAVKDENNERPIPSAWRSAIRQIVGAFAQHDYALSVGVAGVAPIPIETAAQVRDYIEDYGAVLLDLSEETWDSSVCIWTGDHWDALIDLWTADEGRSDLALNLRVFEGDPGTLIAVHMVYVP